MIKPMDSSALFQSMPSNLGISLLERTRAPHIDDSSDSDYLGDEEEEMEPTNTGKENAPSPSREVSVVSFNSRGQRIDISRCTSRSGSPGGSTVDESEDDEDGDIDLADIEMELSCITESKNKPRFVTKGGPESHREEEPADDLKDSKQEDVAADTADTVDIDGVINEVEELERLLHDDQVDLIPQPQETLVNDRASIGTLAELERAFDRELSAAPPVVSRPRDVNHITVSPRSLHSDKTNVVTVSINESHPTKSVQKKGAVIVDAANSSRVQLQKRSQTKIPNRRTTSRREQRLLMDQRRRQRQQRAANKNKPRLHGEGWKSKVNGRGLLNKMDRSTDDTFGRSLLFSDQIGEGKDASDNSENETIGDLLSQTDAVTSSQPQQGTMNELLLDKESRDRTKAAFDDGTASVMSERPHIMFQDEKLAFDAIYKAVEVILMTATEEERQQIFNSKKILRKLVANKLQISRKQYKHVIDQCGRKCGTLFIQSRI